METNAEDRSPITLLDPVLGESSLAANADRTWLHRNSPFILLAAVLVFLAIVRLRVADIPLERDEGEYAYSGQLILRGIPPYQLAYNMKFPGTYYAYSVLLALFGQTPWGIHAGLLVVNFATIVMIFFLARRLLGDSMGAAIAASAFGFLSVDRWIMGIFAHATHFVVFTAMAGLLVLFRAVDSRRSFQFGLAGTLLGLSLLMKQNGIFFLLLGLGIAGWSEIRTAPRNLRAALFRIGQVAAGAAIPCAITGLLLVAQGVFGKFWFWTFQYAKEYVSQLSIIEAVALFTVAVGDITRTNWPIWLLALTGVALLWLAPWTWRTRIVLTAFLVVSFIAVCPGFYFRRHYFILLLPAAALFCATAVLSIERLLRLVLRAPAARVISVGLFITAAGMYVIGERNYLFSIPTSQLSQDRYGANPFVEAPVIARYIQTHTDPEDRIAVLGSEPEIYLYANRKSVTGYIYTYALMEQQKYSQRMQEEMIAEVNANNPKYVVYVGIRTSWLWRTSEERIFSWTKAYLAQCYDLTGIADISRTRETHWVWDAGATGYQPQSEDVVYVFRKKSDTPCLVP